MNQFFSSFVDELTFTMNVACMNLDASGVSIHKYHLNTSHA